MTRTRSVLGGSILLTAILLVTSACAGATPPPPEASGVPEPTPSAPSPSTTVEPTEGPTAAPTCDTIIASQIVADFESVGWTFQAEPFRVGEKALEDGIQCVWGDFTTATDHVQIYGWAPISDQEADDAQDRLVDAGWRIEDTPEGVIVTESAETTFAPDADGYGLTYLFGDGWVKYADTKQGLLLIVWPSA
ncbi:MAG TPA: hypothetical protein VNP97_14595 [Microbacterium sp.]|nr:hypothetical protein [Microbacterium sp.]